MGGRRVPSPRHHIHETRKLYPKEFKFERSRPPWATNIGKEKRAMVRERRGERIKDMSAKADVPLVIAIESVKIA
jgi:hypothetical protein